MYNVLHVYPQLNCGGTEMVIKNLIQFSNRESFVYSILVQRSGEQDKVFEDMGCRLYVVPYTSENEYYNSLLDLFEHHTFQAVHAHMHSHMPSVLKAARDAGIKHRLVHSHNARIDIPRLIWPIRRLFFRKYEKYATHFLGCSRLALKWLFPHKWREGLVIYNAIDLEKFSFNEESRFRVRKMINLSSDTKLVLNVGRCTKQKNQGYILDLAKALKNEDFLFVIIGSGPLLEQLRQRVSIERINNVRLIGERYDISDWLCASDLFVFPSIYEGLGIVAIEAQASGLSVLSADTIPEEVDMDLGLFHRLSIKHLEKWIDSIRENKTDYDRMSISRKSFGTKYNIHTVVREVESLYTE